MNLTILCGDALEQLRTLPDCSVQCCVTSPPYWGLRDYGVPGQLGLEKTPEEYVAKMVALFREVRRVLKDDGTLWLNLGDSYAASGKGGGGNSIQHNAMGREISEVNGFRCPPRGYKPKDLVGIPWMVAFSLRADGWYLRQDIIWSKPNPMPESVRDRCTKAHEYIFLLSKSQRYFYDADAIAEAVVFDDSRSLKQNWPKNWGYGDQPRDAISFSAEVGRNSGGMKMPSNFKGSLPGRKDGPGQERRSRNDRKHDGTDSGSRDHSGNSLNNPNGLRNKRSVWTVATSPFPDAHFATYPPDLVKPCILADSKAGDVILDPFGGSGTTGMVAIELGRTAILFELNPEYVKLIDRRCHVTIGLPLSSEVVA